MPTLAQYQASLPQDGSQPQQNGATEACIDGKHYIYDESAGSAVHVGDCEDPKHQVVNAAQKASQASQGKPQEGAAVSGDKTSQQAPSQLLNKLLGTGDQKAMF